MTQKVLTFFEHLDELRKRLILSLGAVGLGAAAGYLCADKILEILTGPLRDQNEPLYFFSPADAFIVKLKIALLAGLVLASPIVISQVWLFVAPALHKNEKRAVAPLAALTSVLFLAGAAFSFFTVMPLALNFFIGMKTAFLRPMISVTEYVGFLTMMTLAFGIAFNLPVFVMAFVLTGLWDAKGLGRYQKHAIVLIFILAAVLTPGPDIASQCLLAAPLVLLFELSVAGAFAVEFLKKKNKRTKAEIASQGHSS
ncbi:MAG: twin-arginine translocase subunit TatC [Candidatus Omnitrophota bacterium]